MLFMLVPMRYCENLKKNEILCFNLIHSYSGNTVNGLWDIMLSCGGGGSGMFIALKFLNSFSC